MATIEEALYAALVGAPGVSGLVGTRVYPYAIPQDVALPAVAYQRVGGPRQIAHDRARAVAAEATIQLTITAEEYSAVKDIVTAVRDLFPFHGVLGGLVRVWLGTVENEVDGYAPLIEAPTTRMDLWFLYSEP